MEMCQCGHRAEEHTFVGAFFFVVIHGHCLACAESPEWKFGHITIRRNRCTKFKMRKGEADQ